MTQKHQSTELLNSCIHAAIELGIAKAHGTDTPEHFTSLKSAITDCIESSSFSTNLQNVDLENMMIKNAYLGYLYAMGELSLEQLPEMFESLTSQSS